MLDGKHNLVIWHFMPLSLENVHSQRKRCGSEPHSVAQEQSHDERRLSFHVAMRSGGAAREPLAGRGNFLHTHRASVLWPPLLIMHTLACRARNPVSARSLGALNPDPELERDRELLRELLLDGDVEDALDEVLHPLLIDPVDAPDELHELG